MRRFICGVMVGAMLTGTAVAVQRGPFSWLERKGPHGGHNYRAQITCPWKMSEDQAPHIKVVQYDPGYVIRYKCVPFS